MVSHMRRHSPRGRAGGSPIATVLANSTVQMTRESRIRALEATQVAGEGEIAARGVDMIHRGAHARDRRPGGCPWAGRISRMPVFPRSTPMATATASAPNKATYRQLYIDGQWTDATGGKRLAVINPATEETIAEVAFGTREDCKKAIAAAKQAMIGWAKLTSWDRAKVLKKTADLVREGAD